MLSTNPLPIPPLKRLARHTRAALLLGAALMAAGSASAADNWRAYTYNAVATVTAVKGINALLEDISKETQGQLSDRGRPARKHRPPGLHRPDVGPHAARAARPQNSRPGDDLMMHRALRLAQAGDVLVVVCQSETSAAQWGDVATSYAVAKGLAGVVVQGCVRDTDGVDAMGFPVWATTVWPAHADKGKGGGVNIPVACGDVLVRPGDLVVADGDGVVVIPRAEAAAVVAAAQAKMRREAEIAEAVRAGATVWDLSGASKAYEKLGIVECDRAFDDAA